MHFPCAKCATTNKMRQFVQQRQFWLCMHSEKGKRKRQLSFFHVYWKGVISGLRFVSYINCHNTYWHDLSTWVLLKGLCRHASAHKYRHLYILKRILKKWWYTDTSFWLTEWCNPSALLQSCTKSANCCSIAYIWKCSNSHLRYYSFRIMQIDYSNWKHAISRYLQNNVIMPSLYSAWERWLPVNN